MAKELPYFKFEPAVYLTGSIQDCSLDAQGLYVNIEAIYWQRDCSLTVERILARFKRQDLIDELVKKEIIKIKKEKIVINFLIAQRKELSKTSKENSKNGSKGAEKRWKGHTKKNSVAMIPPLAKDEKPIAFRREEKREDEKRKDDIKLDLEKELFNSYTMIENCTKIIKLKADWITIDWVKNELKNFILEQRAKENFDSRTIEEIRNHFVMWVKKVEIKTNEERNPYKNIAR